MSLRARLALLFAAVAIGGVALVSVFAYVSTRTELDTETTRFLDRRSDEIARGLRQTPRGQLPQGGSDLVTDPDAIVQTLNPEGAVATSTGSLPISSDDIALAAHGGQPIVRDIDVDGEPFRMITKAQFREGRGAIQVARSLSEGQDVLSRLRIQLLAIGGTVALGAAAIGWLFARSTTGPLRTLASTAERVAATGDLDIRVGTDRTDEVGRVARSFEAMTRALRTSREQQRRLVEDAGHELRTPLTALRTDVSMLRRAPDDYDPAKRDELLANVESEVVELSDLTSELIALATDSHDAEPFAELDLADAVTAAVERARRRTGRTITLEAASTPIVGQPSQLERAVSNLLGNAHKFSPPEAPIEVSVAGGSVRVRDHGPGIAEADRARVFDRFYRSDLTRSAPGSGLGLAIVDQIVRQHQGSPFAEAADGGGAVVGFHLPARPRHE